MRRDRSQIGAAGLLGLAGVLLGAIGAHALQPRLEESGMADAWETAVLYHLVHAVALLAAGFFARAVPVSKAAALSVTICWTGGILLFSGSIYLLALGGPAFLGPVTPLGGLLLIAGWVSVTWMGLAGHRNQ